tara:strand:+ start:167 stop:397 length:231 start_codon:yes stop_codon:yes gene_type:complete
MEGNIKAVKVIERHNTKYYKEDEEFLAMEVQVGEDAVVLVSRDDGKTWDHEPTASFYPYAGGITYVLPVDERQDRG